ncbi:hypothetical protein RHSIM_Rhsim08G0126400 [Rhododendron simsii]|uniref:Uncharacterized protein n=1 Tax=Rhododendron simsii TaxID=118357 RepID=A0A834LH33_RHOSS|nr:hypothetical protein RHSIM_Rhsim08G0126400 [Rhododendron simsii]
MSRRNVPKPFIPTKTTNPARARGTSDQQQREKRQKTSNKPTPPSSSQPMHPEELRAPTPRADIPEPHVDTNELPSETIVRREFSPSYTNPEGRVVLLNDSTKAEPGLAVTLLRGLALPRDMDQVPTDLLPRIGEMCLHLVQAGQAALKAYDKATKVAAKRERYKSDRDSARQEGKTWEQQAKASGMKWRGEASKFYKLGYAAFVDEMAGVMVIEPELGFLKQLLEPVVPDLELPYTEEECQLLPPEEDEDEQMTDAERQQEGIGENVAEGGGRGKFAKAEAQDKVAEDEIYDLD